jgi:phage terminase small subunit
MPALKDPKLERFAQLIADGEPAAVAYRDAGYTKSTDPKQVAKNAYAMRNRRQVKERISEISLRRAEIHERAETISITRAVEKQVVSRERIITELARLGFADLRKAVKWGTREIALVTDEEDPNFGEVRISSSVELINSADLDDDTAAAIIEVKTTRDGVSIKMADKRAALMDLARIMGMVIDRKESGGPGDFDGLTDDELRAIVEGRASAAGARRAGDGVAEPPPRLHGPGKPH